MSNSLLSTPVSGPSGTSMTVQKLEADNKIMKAMFQSLLKKLTGQEIRQNENVLPTLKDFSLLPFANTNTTGEMRDDKRLRNLSEILQFEKLLQSNGKARQQFVSN